MNKLFGIHFPKFATVLVVLVLVFGSVIFHHTEGWSYFDSFYFSVITLTTIGYGDFAPQSVIGKIFTMLYVFLGIGVIFGFINYVSDKEVKRLRRK